MRPQLARLPRSLGRSLSSGSPTIPHKFPTLDVSSTPTPTPAPTSTSTSTPTPTGQTTENQKNPIPKKQSSGIFRLSIPWNAKPNISFNEVEFQPKTSQPALLGITRFLQLQPVPNPPGIEFDLKSLRLSVAKGASDRLQYLWDPSKHKARPYLAEPLIKRAKGWAELNVEDLKRVRTLKMRNSTLKRHRGCLSSHIRTLFDFSRKPLKPRDTTYNGLHGCVAKNLGPTLPPTIYGHLDGVFPEDVELLMECHKHKSEDEDSRFLTCLWISVNAPYGVCQRTWESLSYGYQPDPELDVVTPVLQNVARYLKKQSRNRRENLRLEQLIDATPENKSIPVVLALRQKYIWFLWTGGIDGKLVAQYASHWLPCQDSPPQCDEGGGNRHDFDQKIKGLQLTHYNPTLKPVPSENISSQTDCPDNSVYKEWFHYENGG